MEQERHKSLYYEDGDMVVSAISRTRHNVTKLFRVDKVFLARHSAIFRGMLSLDQAFADIDVNEKYDGVPKVHLTDDAEDVEGLLAAIYDIRFVIDHLYPGIHRLTLLNPLMIGLCLWKG